MRISDWSSDVCSADLSLEDRIVKRFIARHAKAPAGNRRLPVVEEFVPALRAIGDARKADSTELAGNPRARSAVLRVAEKLGLGIGDSEFDEKQVRRGGKRAGGATLSPCPIPNPQDRNSVPKGKGVSVRVDPGGRRSHKKKK